MTDPSDPRPTTGALVGPDARASDPASAVSRPGADPGQREPVLRDPVLDIPPAILQRHNARVLDPTTALRVAGRPAPRSTVYIADRILVSASVVQSDSDVLAGVAESLGLELRADVPAISLRSGAATDPRRDQPVDRVVQRLLLVPIDTGEPTPAPDAWRFVQAYRARVGFGNEATGAVSLDHLMTSCRHTNGSPFAARSPYEATSSYGIPGSGGRQPVNWLGPPPRRAELKGRRPVVAVLDTGVGEHDWLPDGIVTVASVALDEPVEDPEATGVTIDRWQGVLDQDAGHGTFIAGLIRQHCPDADILAIPIMAGDGVVAESDLIDALRLVAGRHRAAARSADESGVVDVVSLSLGYYHEETDVIGTDHALLQALTTLGDLGIAVVAAAGNDATDRPMFPAAFAPWSGGPVTPATAPQLPVTSVGARNPNGTVALFSNVGEWVTCTRPGAAVVSTFPRTFNGSQQAAYLVEVNGVRRATIDPDDFTSGFGVWSGTSFAGPVLAGQIAARLSEMDLSALDAASGVERAGRARDACLAEDPR